MRKIYSLVLMTAMLFIGTNAWAVTVHSVSNDTELRNAFNTPSTGETPDTIRLTAPINLTNGIQITDGSNYVLDMQGFRIEYTAQTGQTPRNFIITHGKLTVIGGGQIYNVTDSTKQFKFEGKEIGVFYLQGSVTATDSAYTVLTVNKGTEVRAQKGKNAIEVYQVSGNKSYGVRVYFDGQCYGDKYGIQLSGTVSVTTPANAQFPYFHIMKNANVSANPTSNKGVGAYAAGYGIWLIEGYVHGSTGVYVKGGDITVNDATIASDNNYDNGIRSGKSSGVDAGGNAIATETNGSYAGNISVTVSGTSTVTAGENGYAIQDKNTSGSESEVIDVTISGGTITGGTNGGAVQIDATTENVVTVDGGTFTGDITTLISHTSDGGSSIIQEVVADDGAGHATIVIGKPAEGSTTPTILPTADDTIHFNLAGVSATDIVKLKASATTGNLSYTLSGVGTTTEMQYLSLKAVPTKSITVTVNAGHTMKVGQIVMDENAQIVVEAGAKLLVTGSNGIFADSENNLILKANATNQALFVISPEVTTNRQPKAKVEFYTSCYKVNATTWKWQRFATPLTATTPVTHDRGYNINTGVKYMDDLTGHWNSIAAWSDLKSFMAASITNDLAEGDTKATYTFSGRLMGNVTDSIKRRASDWNYYGNTFVAPISTIGLLNVLNSSNMSKVIYVWDFDAQGYTFVSPGMFDDWGEGLTEIPAMGFFVLRNNNSEAGALNIDYDNSIYNFALGVEPVLSAPARSNNSNANRVRINVQAENGMSDVVYLLENDNYSAEYEDGADVEKMMSEGLNLYVAGDMNLSMLYTDDLQGTLLTLQTTEAINYTMTFGKVNGEVYALRDNMTNAVVLMNEGATYNFTAQPNATLDGRFQIVSRQEMPTAVETIEETVTPKAIYTIMGQYVGETTDWNNLPAGVYVIDGVKVIK